jgi:putative ABC transport system permease protein
MAPHLPRLSEPRSDGLAAGLVAVLSVIVGVVVGLLPALTAIRPQAPDALREVHRATASRARQRIRASLIVVEVAMAMVLTVGAGLLLRSFVAVLNVEPGFSAARLLTFQTAIPSRIQTMDAYLAYYDELEARLRALPGVTHVGGTTRLPLGSTNVTTMVDVEGRPVPVADRPEVELRRAVFDYFGTMGIPLLRGRVFRREDAAGPVAAVVNTAFVDRVFPTEDPIGRRVRIGSSPNAAWITIVGVVGSVKHGSLEETPRPELYLDYRQGVVNSPFVALRTTGDPAALAVPVRATIRELGGDPPTAVHTMEDLRRASVAQRRFVLMLTAIFGVLALGLAAIGVYGVIALVAVERTREVGIRLALGATPPEVFRLLLAQAARLAGSGVAAGAVVALLLTPALGSQLFGVGSADPATYLIVAGILVATALVAALGPARRAMRTDPAHSLRS